MGSNASAGGELGTNLWSKVGLLDLCFLFTGPNFNLVPFSDGEDSIVDVRFKVNELFGEPIEVVGESTPGSDTGVFIGGDVIIAKLAKV